MKRLWNWYTRRPGWADKTRNRLIAEAVMIGWCVASFWLPDAGWLSVVLCTLTGLTLLCEALIQISRWQLRRLERRRKSQAAVYHALMDLFSARTDHVEEPGAPEEPLPPYDVEKGLSELDSWIDEHESKKEN